jgi:hypothetical protein
MGDPLRRVLNSLAAAPENRASKKQWQQVGARAGSISLLKKAAGQENFPGPLSFLYFLSF